MDDNDGNDAAGTLNNSRTPGNPYISGSLCAAYRETMKSEINKITFTVKLTALILGLILTSVQLTLHFLG